MKTSRFLFLLGVFSLIVTAVPAAASGGLVTGVASLDLVQVIRTYRASATQARASNLLEHKTLMVNHLAFLMVYLSESKFMTREVLNEVNELENDLGGEVVNAPILFSVEKKDAYEQMDKGSHFHWEPSILASYTHKLRASASRQGIQIPEYKGILHFRI